MSAGSLQTSSARPLRLRMRPDLVATRARYQGMRYWLVKDPVGLRYFRFQDEEFSLLQLLDGQRSIDDIKTAFEESFRPQKITVEELQRFIGHLHASGLVLSHNPGQGERLLQRARKIRRKKFFSFLANILFVKFPGIDPERILRRLHPKLRWFFTPVGVLGALALMFSALTLVIVNFDTFAGQPEFQSFSNFFNIYNVVWMWVALGIVKVIHEFGHGLTCTNFGGECHEMGILFLLFTPCLYCNVSDSWMMPNKWHRIWISAAGIYVEVVLASLATFLWWNTEPGILHSLAFSTMFICSVSTFLFNANPLLRYDGYYILMDLLEIPNLRAKSGALLQQAFAKWCLGIETPDDPFMPKTRRWMFITYAVASYFYRWLVTFSILWFLYSFLGTLPDPWNKLRSLSWILASGAISTLVVVPTVQMVKFLMSPGRTVEVKKRNIAISASVAAAALAVVLFIPFPLRVKCAVTIEPLEEATPIYVRYSGVLETIGVQPGKPVSQGEVLGQLVNGDLDREIEQIKGQRDQQKARVETLSALQQIAQFEAAQEQLKTLQAQLDERLALKRDLTLVAPHDGIVIPPPELPQPDATDIQRKLTGWYGHPLKPENAGAFLQTGQLFCTVGPVDRWDAVLFVDQADYEYVCKGQTVWIKLDGQQEQTLEGAVDKIAPDSLEVAPQELSNKSGGTLPTETGPDGVERPVGAFYQVRVILTDAEGLLRPGFRGRAKIAAGWRTLAQRGWRWATDTFHFKL